MPPKFVTIVDNRRLGVDEIAAAFELDIAVAGRVEVSSQGADGDMQAVGGFPWRRIGPQQLHQLLFIRGTLAPSEEIAKKGRGFARLPKRHDHTISCDLKVAKIDHMERR